jgi:hypothetical protein
MSASTVWARAWCPRCDGPAGPWFPASEDRVSLAVNRRLTAHNAVRHRAAT